MDHLQQRLRRALPFAMAMLLLTLVPMQSVSALFGKKNTDAVQSSEGAPIAENMSIRVYRGVSYVGAFRAVDNEGGTLTFRIVTEPKKGTAEVSEDGLGFVYTAKNKTGADSFTYAAVDEEGNTSLPATVSITIERAASGVSYADMEGERAHTAAIDLAEEGVFVGAKVGENYFFEPERTLSRGEFIVMSMAAMGMSTEEVNLTGFCDDALIPTWAKGSAVSALNEGIITGVSTEEGVALRANDTITLNEAAVVLNRLLRVTDVDLSDYDAHDAWCAQAVANLESVSIIESGRFSADEMRAGVTRAQAAEILGAAMTLKEAKAERGLLGAVFG